MSEPSQDGDFGEESKEEDQEEGVRDSVTNFCWSAGNK